MVPKVRGSDVQRRLSFRLKALHEISQCGGGPDAIEDVIKRPCGIRNIERIQQPLSFMGAQSGWPVVMQGAVDAPGRRAFGKSAGMRWKDGHQKTPYLR